MEKGNQKNLQFDIVNGSLHKFGERYEKNVRFIFDQWSKLYSSFDSHHEIQNLECCLFKVPGIASTEEDVWSEHNPTGTNKHNVFFLKQLEHARALRNRIIECFERASSNCSEAERQRLLTFLVVGGGKIS